MASDFALHSTMLGSENPEKLAEFYEKVFGKEADMHEGSWWGWQVGNFFFNVEEHSEVSGSAKEPERFIFNLETTKVSAEFKRLKELGAMVIKEPYEMQGMEIATLADPDGNYFQLMSPWEEAE